MQLITTFLWKLRGGHRFKTLPLNWPMRVPLIGPVSVLKILVSMAKLSGEMKSESIRLETASTGSGIPCGVSLNYDEC